jgi:excisionase family DNA binding protein
MEEMVLTPKEIENMLKISSYTLKKMISEGEITVIKIGSLVRIPLRYLPQEVQDFYKESRCDKQ